MGKKKQIDPGLMYLQEIGFDRIRGPYGLHDRWIRMFGRSRANELFKQFNSFSPASQEFYEFKNSNPEISKSFAECFDGDILRKACNYVASHKEYFGESILEVGCDTGYMTGFLAKMFPNSKITSIDRNKNGIKLASKRIEEMGIQNVEFRCLSLSAVSEEFDTVFCMRTIQENTDRDMAIFEGEPIIPQILRYSELTSNYTDLLKSCLKADGKLCVFERLGQNPFMFGWMMTLCNSNCPPNLDTYSEIECNEVEENNTFQAFICTNGLTEDPGKMMELWRGTLQNNSTEKVLTTWTALWYLKDHAGSLIRGVRIYDGDVQVGRFAVFYDRSDESLIYYLVAAGGNGIYQYTYKASELDDTLEHIQKSIDTNLKAGLSYEEIDINDEYLEGK